MYNPVTTELISGAPALEGLDSAQIPQKLSEAYARIVSARLFLATGPDTDALNATLDALQRMACTYEGLVFVLAEDAPRRSAAFVAASAYSLLQAYHVRTQEPRVAFGAESIAPWVSAALLFLVAESPADARQVVKAIRASDGTHFSDLLSNCLCAFCRGASKDAVAIAGREVSLEDSLEERATSVLYTSCLKALGLLARSLCGDGEELLLESREELSRIRNLAAITVSLRSNEKGVLGATLSTFPGPYHLTRLLACLADDLPRNSLACRPSPPGCGPDRWRTVVERIAPERPWLWFNHAQALDTGYLAAGVSAVIGLPTGAGKTTLAEFKISLTLDNGGNVIFLAPTNALVDQVTAQMKAMFPTAAVRNSFISGGEYAESEGNSLADLTVMTPERCLTLLSVAPDAFHAVKLVIFDECHILHATNLSNCRRAVDAMLCLLDLLQHSSSADFILLSAMVNNVTEISDWIAQQTGRPCMPIKIEWKPTRQLRGCIVYRKADTDVLEDHLAGDQKIAKSARKKRKAPGAEVKRLLHARPYCFFCLHHVWHTRNQRDYALLPLLETAVKLSVNPQWHLTANRNQVAAQVAAALGSKGVKTLVFCQAPRDAAAIASTCASELAVAPRVLVLTQEERLLRQAAIEEAGGETHTYAPTNAFSACHHSLLLKEERLLNEALFRRKDGLRILVATPTLAQGMNLPAEAVIIAGDDRFDKTLNRMQQMEAQELLNAAGRAGRAGEVAQGVVIVIPGQVVSYDADSRNMGPGWFKLQENVFSKADQCLDVEDPLGLILDSLQEASASHSHTVKYAIARLAHAPGLTAAERFPAIGRSFFAFKKRQANESAAIDEFQGKAEQFWQGINTSGGERESWIDELASATGLPSAALQSLAESLTNAERAQGTEEWIGWLLENTAFRTLSSLRDRGASQGSGGGDDSDVQEEDWLSAIEQQPGLLFAWCQGKTLCEIERMFGTATHALKQCFKARKLALRWAPELSYAAGVVAQLFRRSFVERNNERMPLALATLAPCIRHGLNSSELLAIMHLKAFGITRVQCHRLASRSQVLAGDPFEPFYATLARCRLAIHSLDPSDTLED